MIAVCSKKLKQARTAADHQVIQPNVERCPCLALHPPGQLGRKRISFQRGHDQLVNERLCFRPTAPLERGRRGLLSEQRHD